MKTKNSKSSFRKKLLWIGLFLTALLFILQKFEVLDWPLWLIYTPIIVALVVFILPYSVVFIQFLIVFIYEKTLKFDLRRLCKKIVQIIQATDESNVMESIKACLENAKLIEERREEFAIIPVSDNEFPKLVLKPTSFLLSNEEFINILESSIEQTEINKAEIIKLLKAYKEVYSSLWF